MHTIFILRHSAYVVIKAKQILIFLRHIYHIIIVMFLAIFNSWNIFWDILILKVYVLKINLFLKRSKILYNIVFFLILFPSFLKNFYIPIPMHLKIKTLLKYKLNVRSSLVSQIGELHIHIIFYILH